MDKNWTTAPWVVRLIFLYWIIPALIIVFGIIALVIIFLDSEMNVIWGIPLDLFKSKFMQMPISMSIDTAFNVIWVLAGYYGWRMIKGSGIARSFLEVVSWLSAIYLFVYLIFPEIEYFELETIPKELVTIPVMWKMVGWLFLILEAAVIFALRRESVRFYANVF